MSRAVTRELENLASQRRLATQARPRQPGPGHRAAPRRMRSASARSLRLRAASPPSLAPGSPPARGEWTSGTPRSANSRRFLVSPRASESLSLGQKPSAEARAGGAGPISGAATPPASVSFLGGGGGGFFRRTICSREWPNLGLTPAGE